MEEAHGHSAVSLMRASLIFSRTVLPVHAMSKVPIITNVHEENDALGRVYASKVCTIPSPTVRNNSAFSAPAAIMMMSINLKILFLRGCSPLPTATLPKVPCIDFSIVSPRHYCTNCIS